MNPLTPPSSIEAEEALIGSVLIDPETFNEIELAPSDFYLQKNSFIWAAMLRLRTSHIAIDDLTVADELTKAKQLSEIGGNAYLTRLITLTPSAYNAPDYARIVKDCATRRKTLDALKEIAKAAYDMTTPVKDALATGAAKLDSLTPVSSQNVDAFDSTWEYYAEVETYLQSDKKIVGLTTGYREIDEKTQGLKRGELCILAAAPSMGKSALAFNMAYRQAKMGLKVGIFSQEMNRQDVIGCMAAALSKLDLRELTRDDLPKLKSFCEEIAPLPFCVNDSSGITVNEIAKQARDMARILDGLDVVIVDHVGYIAHVGERGDNLSTRIGNTTKALARLSKDMRLAVLCLCQLNRASQREGDPPKLTDLRDSGNIEADARQVWGLHRDDYYADADTVDPKVLQATDLIVLKNHTGPRNVAAHLGFYEYCRLFTETETRTINVNDSPKQKPKATPKPIAKQKSLAI